ncbi:MAG: hypothetical protein WEB09_09770 [Nitriliruptor sp.]
MPFVHCPDCGASAMIDPSGRCPEGHIVGVAGARVAAAIGRSTPHPDEPQPWVATVAEGPDAPVEDAPVEDAPRTVQPPSIPTAATVEPIADPGTATGPGVAAAAGAEDLLREIHELGDLELAADTAAAATPGPGTTSSSATSVGPSPVAPVRQDATGGTPAPPSSPEEATDLDALANLAAAVRTLDDRDAHAPAATPGVLPTSGPTEDDLPPPPPFDTAPVDAPLEAVVPTPHAPTSHDVADAHADEVTTELAPPAVLLSPFDGSFTARGDRVPRGPAPAKSGGLKGLFRR